MSRITTHRADTTAGATTAARIDLRINMRRATTVGLTSFATLTLVPLLVQAKPSERVLLLLAAVPAAALFGYLAGYATGSDTHLDAGRLHATQQDLQLRTIHLEAAQRSASTADQSLAPVIRLVSESIPRPETGPPTGSGHLTVLTGPPAEQHQRAQRRLHLVSTHSREVSSATATVPGADGESSVR